VLRDAPYDYYSGDLTKFILGRYKAMKTKACGMVLLVAVLAFSLAGCGCFMQAQKGEAPPPKPPEEKVVIAPEQKQEVIVPPAAPAPVPEPAVAAVPGLSNVYFDFDRYNIRPGDADTLKKNLDWFKANGNTKVRIEGNCDERGTAEYNLALGQKRADAAKNYLVGLGIDAKLLDTISYGKERPICTEHNEACWARNRTDAFVPVK
jgi:peptidoglycan-associated lipoprotein